MRRMNVSAPLFLYSHVNDRAYLHPIHFTLQATTKARYSEQRHTNQRARVHADSSSEEEGAEHRREPWSRAAPQTTLRNRTTGTQSIGGSSVVVDAIASPNFKVRRETLQGSLQYTRDSTTEPEPCLEKNRTSATAPIRAQPESRMKQKQRMLSRNPRCRTVRAPRRTTRAQAVLPLSQPVASRSTTNENSHRASFDHLGAEEFTFSQPESRNWLKQSEPEDIVFSDTIDHRLGTQDLWAFGGIRVSREFNSALVLDDFIARFCERSPMCWCEHHKECSM